MKNKIAFILCLIAGIIFIEVAWTGNIGIFAYLSNITTVFPQLASLEVIINWTLYILTFLAGLGGIAVIIGAILVTTERTGIGKFVIGLGVGMSLIGIIINLVMAIWLGGLTGVYDMFLVSASITGWIGIILSIIGRRKIES